MAPEAFPDPELLAKIVAEGIRTGNEVFKPVIDAVAQMLADTANKIEQDRRASVNELMSRCRHLVEFQGQRQQIGRVAYYRYDDQDLSVEWQYPTGDPPYAVDAIMSVYDRTTGSVAHCLNTNLPKCDFPPYRLEQHLVRLRQTMILEDITRQI